MSRFPVKMEFYNMYNPKLWKEIDKSATLSKELRNKIKEHYESRSNGIASLGTIEDNVRSDPVAEIRTHAGKKTSYPEIDSEILTYSLDDKREAKALQEDDEVPKESFEEVILSLLKATIKSGLEVQTSQI